MRQPGKGRERGLLRRPLRILLSWNEYSLAWRFGGTRYEITVSNPERRCRGIAEAELDGAAVDPSAIPLADDGRPHEVRLVLGARKRTPSPAVKEGAPAPA